MESFDFLLLLEMVGTLVEEDEEANFCCCCCALLSFCLAEVLRPASTLLGMSDIGV